MTTLGWYPPAPAEGPVSMLDLPPDDWACEVKMNGCRVIINRSFIFTRHGTLLSKCKGALRIPCFWQDKVLPTLEGEWIDRERVLWLFDLPDHPGTYDERRLALSNLVQTINDPKVRVIPAEPQNFRSDLLLTILIAPRIV